MKELDKTKSYDLSKLNEEQIKQLAEYVYENRHKEQSLIDVHNTKMWIQRYMNTKLFCFYTDPEGDNLWGFGNRQFYTLTICATTLFEEDVWIPKQGDVVLWKGGSMSTYEKGVFISKYKEFFIIEFESQCHYAKEIQPFKEEIKVGDWVINKFGRIYKLSKTCLTSQCYNLKKITDKNTIQVLESILVD